MLLWKELIDEAQGREAGWAASKDDLKLLQMYLCRLYLTPGYGNTLSLFHAEESMAFLGIQEHEGAAELTSTVDCFEAIRKREKVLTASLKGKPALSFEPLLAILARLLKPSVVELKLLIYAVLLLKHPQARKVLHDLDISAIDNSVNALARAMRVSPRMLARALDPDAILCQIRLLEAPSRGNDIWDLVETGPLLAQLVLAASDVSATESEQDIEQMLFRHVCPPAPEAQRRVGDFKGVPELQLMMDYLQIALDTKARGKNILLHGKPGTGKTQLARAMAAKLAAPLYEVPTKDARAGAMTGRIRLDAAKLAQMFLEDRLGAILLFDEMEDAFRNSEHLAKGWFNQLLEENQAPVIWISNNIEHVDPAFLRRFDFIIEIKGAGTALQADRLKKQLQTLPVSPAWAAQAAKQAWMTPALAKNLTDVAQALPAKQISRNQRRLESLIEQRLAAMGEHRPIQVLKATRRTDFPEFRSDWINTRPTLRNVERLARQEGAVRICLYGPPGAGKTAYAQILAERLNKPFMLQSASDLLGMYVGETEKNIARMFLRAEKTGAVLLLDEADTFLYSRAMAERSWEVSAINEFMIRLERFEGVFLATTNRFDSFDKAILRRFQLKVQFSYLSIEQVKAIITACVVDKDIANGLTTDQLSHLHHLTPGLIRAAVEGLRLRGYKARTRPLLEALENEQQQHTNGIVRRSIGFVQ